LRNHAPDIAAMDLFVVPTIGFDLLYAFVIVRLDRRDLVWINVTANPNAEWVAHQIAEAFSLERGSALHDPGPRSDLWCRRHTPTACHGYLGQAYRTGLALAERGFAERLIGSIRRECLDHVIIRGEAHLRRILKSYADYYNGVRTHRSLNKDAPVSRPLQLSGIIRSHPILGGFITITSGFEFSVHTTPCFWQVSAGATCRNPWSEMI
jgi:hypothetical protein